MNGLNPRRERPLASTRNAEDKILEQAFFFQQEDLSLSGLLQWPAGSCRDMLWIVCPGLGIDYMNAYRGLRHLSESLVEDGYAVLRFDYAGTGSSGDPSRGVNLLPFWLRSIGAVIDHGREGLGFERIGLIGLRFGATLAALACRDHACNALALWSPVSKGSQLIREVRMLRDASETDSQADLLEAAGWVINPPTQEAVAEIDLASFRPGADRVLIIDAADARRSRRLFEAWSAPSDEGTRLEFEAIDETRDLLVDAHNTRIPEQTIQAVRRWARQLASNASIHAGEMRLPSNRARMKACPESVPEGVLLQEASGYTASGLFAIQAAPPTGAPDADKPLVLMLNSGANHQVGPNRLYVTLARMLAARGLESLRLDLPGLGETPAQPGDEENLPYMPEPIEPLRRLVEEMDLQDRPLILLGLCSGAYHAFLSAIELRNADVREVVLINPLTFYWEQGMTLEDAPSVAYGEWNWYQQSARDLDRWKRLLTGQINPMPILGSLGSRMMQKIRTRVGRAAERFERSPEDQISPSLRNSLLKIERRGVKLTLLFADTDPGLSILRDRADSTLKAMIRRGSADLQLISGADHTFSRLRPRKALLDWIDGHFSS